MSTNLTTLPSGLRIITDHIAEMDTVAIGIWADVGTRDEDLEHNGIAHLVEHMVFKGTPTRGPQDIAEQIENVGGDLNAFTSREMTAYFVHLLKEDAALALNILADFIQNPTFPQDELDKERQVILQEIGMNNDTPDDLIFDLYQETAYRGQAFGAPILGTADIIERVPREALFSYIAKLYTPNRLVISAAGHVDHDAVVKQAEKLFTTKDTHTITYIPVDYTGGEQRAHKALEQSHIVLGFRSVDRLDPNYYTAMLLSSILGGGMASRLFQEVREKRGLVYSVHASNTSYKDEGQIEIYAGTGPDRLQDLIPVLCDEVCKISQDIVTDNELKRAKAQFKASLLMSRESMLSRANRQAKYLINFGETVDIQTLIGQIDAVNAEQIRDLARTIFTSKPTLAALGPLDNLESFEHIQERLAA